MRDDKNSLLPPNPLDDPENARQIAVLEKAIEELGHEQKEVEALARELLEKELAGQGVFAQEIFRLKQRKMELITDAQAKRARINQILWGMV